MKISLAVRWVLIAAGAWMATMGAGAQMPDGPAPGFGQNKPPFERSLGIGGALGHWWDNPRIVEKLKLTDEQRKAMGAILLEHRRKLIDLRGNVQKAELDLEPLMNADQPNETKLLTQIDGVAQARAELEKANARFLLALRGKLTLDQWKQLQEMRAAGGPMRNQWGDHGAHSGARFHPDQAPPQGVGSKKEE